MSVAHRLWQFGTPFQKPNPILFLVPHPCEFVTSSEESVHSLHYGVVSPAADAVQIAKSYFEQDMILWDDSKPPTKLPSTFEAFIEKFQPDVNPQASPGPQFRQHGFDTNRAVLDSEAFWKKAGDFYESILFPPDEAGGRHGRTLCAGALFPQGCAKPGVGWRSGHGLGSDRALK